MSDSNENQTIPVEMRLAWDQTLKAIERLIRPQYFQSFILTIRLVQAKDGVLVLGFPDRFYRDWVYDHYSALIQEKFDEISEHQFKLEFVVDTKNGSIPEAPAKPKQPLAENSPRRSSVNTPSQTTPKTNRNFLSAHSTLNTKYTFETFVVGASNQFAHAASFTVAEGPGRHYNPLFIYGDVGLGKTHLMNAVGLKIQEKFPSMRIHYTTFENFTNHMIESIRFERMEEFRERYRKNCDVLIIDDIQFISGKERTQEEFFHTFNSLYEHKKQIVLSSDRPPREIEGLEDRLRSRFEMGLLVDIQAPEIETRVAIIFKKAEMDGIKISSDVAFFLAKLYKSNIRELEGALLKLSAFASLTGSELNLDLAKKVLKEERPEAKDIKINPEQILKMVAHQFQMSLADLKSERKNRQLALPRQLAMYLCRKYSHLSLPDIGTLFGGKNHTTVLHAIRRIGKLQDADPLLKESITKLESSLRDISP